MHLVRLMTQARLYETTKQLDLDQVRLSIESESQSDEIVIAPRAPSLRRARSLGLLKDGLDPSLPNNPCFSRETYLNHAGNLFN